MIEYDESEMSPFDLVALEELLESFGRRDLVCLEIGSWFGAGSTQLIAKYAKTLVCVDHWKGNDTDHHIEVVSEINVFERFRQNVRPFGDVIVPMMGNSETVCSLLADGTFDFAFIDGDHRYAPMVAELRTTKRLVREGGMLCGHDCEGRVDADNIAFMEANEEVDHVDSIYTNFRHCHPGVIRAVHEEVGRANLYAEAPLVVDGRKGCSSIWWKKMHSE